LAYVIAAISLRLRSTYPTQMDGYKYINLLIKVQLTFTSCRRHTKCQMAKSKHFSFSISSRQHVAKSDKV